MSTKGIKQGSGWKKDRTIVLAIVIIGACLSMVALVGTSIPSNSNSLAPTLTIWGNVDTRDSQKQPIQILFIETDSDNVYVGSINDVGFYDMELPDGKRNYDVDVKWMEKTGSSGTCKAGSLAYQSPHPLVLIRDYVC